jgi:hypothetical protein
MAAKDRVRRSEKRSLGWRRGGRNDGKDADSPHHRVQDFLLPLEFRVL